MSRGTRPRTTVTRLGLMPLVAILLAAVSSAAEESVPHASPLQALYDINRLGDYAAQVSWRFVRNDGNKTWLCRGEGTAIFIGEGRFLTAAHVIDQNPLTDDCAEFGTAEPTIEFGSAQLPGRVLRLAPWADEGGLTYPGGMDLALIEVDARMVPVALRSAVPLALCEAAPPFGAKVLVATEYGIETANTQPRTNDEYARIDFVARRGHSGGGVFDPVHHCLIGIISNGGASGTNYVANELVRRFLAVHTAAQPPEAQKSVAIQKIDDSAYAVPRSQTDLSR